MNRGDEVATPWDLFNALHAEFNFVYDLAANGKNTKIPLEYFSKKKDALKQDWSAILKDRTHNSNYLFLNPPFSAGNINRFMAKCAAENDNGARIVVILRLDFTGWFNHFVWDIAREVRMIPRIKFMGADSSYPFPLCVAVYDGRPAFKKTRFYPWDYRTVLKDE